MVLKSHLHLALATLALLHSSQLFNLHSTSPTTNRLEPVWTGPNQLVGFAHAQNDGGGDQSGLEQTDDPLQQDPNMLNPQNKQGYGKNIPTQVLHKKSQGNKKNKRANKVKSIGEQTFQAALQLGVLVAVSLLVGVLFFVNIGIELCCDAVWNKITDFCGRSKGTDIEEQDPASLVGTFKRYK